MSSTSEPPVAAASLLSTEACTVPQQQHRSKRSPCHTWPDAAASQGQLTAEPLQARAAAQPGTAAAAAAAAATSLTAEACGTRPQHRTKRAFADVWSDAAERPRSQSATELFMSPASAPRVATAAPLLCAEAVAAQAQHRSKRSPAGVWSDAAAALRSDLALETDASTQPGATAAAAAGLLPAEVFALLELPPELLAQVLRCARPTVQCVCRAFRTAWCDGRTTLTVHANPAAAAVDAPNLRGLLMRLPLLESLETRNVNRIRWAGCCSRLREVIVHNSFSPSLARLMDVHGTRVGRLCHLESLLEQYEPLVQQIQELQLLLPQQQLPPQQLEERQRRLDEQLQRVEGRQLLLLEEHQRLQQQQQQFAVALTPLQAADADALRPMQALERQKAVPWGAQPELPSRLTSMSLCCCSNLGDLGAISVFRRLRTLVFHECPALIDLDPLAKCAELESLRLSHCLALVRLDALARCARLDALWLLACNALTSVAPLAACHHLASLSLQSCWNLVDGAVAVAAMTQLTALDVSQQPNFYRLLHGQPVASQQLATLAIVSCLELRDVRSLVSPSLSTLRRLDFSECLNLASVDGLSACVSLSSVNFRRCVELRDVGGALTGSLRSLTTLDLSFCAGVASFALLSGCSGLTMLQLQGCTQLMSEEEGGVGMSSSARVEQHLTGVGALSTCMQLRTLELSGCSGLASVAALAPLVRLQALNLCGCRRLTDVAPLAALTALTDLDLTQCAALDDITPLRACTALASLSIENCRLVASIDPLAACTRLAKLWLNNCTLLRDVGALRYCRHLTTLALNNCTSIADAAPLASCTALASLSLVGCRFLSFAPLAACRKLERVNLYGCRRLTSLSPLRSSAATLTALHIGGCVGLRSLRPLTGCSQLTLLDLDGCVGVRSLQPLRGCAATLKTLMLRGVPDCHDMRVLAALTASCRVYR